MFYESISHEILPVADATEAATKIKEGKVRAFQALFWQNTNGKFYAVSDSHINNSAFAETALIQQIDTDLFQIESITAAWISANELADTFIRTETDPPIKSKTQLIIGKATDQVADFWCGCCGRQFEDNVAKQHAHDQDDGYGICTNCEQYYK